MAIFNGLSSAQLAASHPVSGGTYEYGYRYLRPALGFTAGWVFLLAKSASAATAALGFAGYVLHGFGMDGPGARVALGLVTAVLFGAPVSGGQQIGYASLVHLETGNIVWFGTLARGTGDLRTPEPAQEAVNSLFSGLPKS